VISTRSRIELVLSLCIDVGRVTQCNGKLCVPIRVAEGDIGVRQCLSATKRHSYDSEILKKGPCVNEKGSAATKGYKENHGYRDALKGIKGTVVTIQSRQLWMRDCRI